MPTSIDEYRMIIKVSYCSFNTHRCLISIYSFRLAEKQLLVWSEAPIIIKTKTALCNGSMKNPYYCHHYKASYIHKYVPLKSLRQGWCRPLSLFVCTFIYIPVLLCLEIYTSIRRRQRKELYQPIDTTRKYMSDPLSISRCQITWHKPEGESISQ